MNTLHLKILCVGDLHLGRRPSRIPLNDPELTVPFVWRQIVSTAIEEEVDLLAIPGDLIDRENRYYEALGPLEQGLQRLQKAQIPTFATAGNHDFDVLPRQEPLLRQLGFHLLGKGGRWESILFEKSGAPALEILGWSFPARHVNDSPVQTFERSRPDLPAIALLHADLDQPQSPYAPISTAELEENPVQAWLLGHIHRSSLKKTPAQNLILTPGSPQPLHPDEAGPHGPWLIEVSPDGRTKARQLPLATVRYQNLPIDLTGLNRSEELQTLIPLKIRDDLIALNQNFPALRHVVYRLLLQGTTALHRHLPAHSQRLIQDLELSFEELHSQVDTLQLTTTPPIDLQELARNNDLAANLARLLLELQSEVISDERRPLFDTLKERLRPVYTATPYAPLLSTNLSLSDDLLKDDRLKELILEQGFMLLTELLRERGHEPSR